MQLILKSKYRQSPNICSAWQIIGKSRHPYSHKLEYIEIDRSLQTETINFDISDIVQTHGIDQMSRADANIEYEVTASTNNADTSELLYLIGNRHILNISIIWKPANSTFFKFDISNEIMSNGLNDYKTMTLSGDGNGNWTGIVDGQIQYNYTFTSTTKFSSSYFVMLWASPSTTQQTNHLVVRVKNIKLKVRGEYVLDLIPVMNNNVPGLYNIIDGSFRYNSGNSECIIAGPVIS